MKNTNQSGFSIVETLLVLVIVGMLGFTGWYVYNSKQAANKSYSTASNSTVPTYTKKASTKTAAKTTVDPYAGWKTYSAAGLAPFTGFSIKYPANFTADATNKPRQYQFSSPDFKIDPNRTSPPYQVSGAAISVRFDPLPSGETTQSYIASQQAHAVNEPNAATIYGLSTFSSSSNSNGLEVYDTYAVKGNIVIAIELTTIDTTGTQLNDLMNTYNLAIKSLTLTYSK